MTRLLAAFLILFAGALGALWLLPSPPQASEPHSAAVPQRSADAQPVSDHPSVRVVYPASGTEAISTAAPLKTAAVVAPVSNPEPSNTNPAALYPQVHDTGVADVVPPTPVNTAAQAGTPNVNINTASIEALNEIPGAGRIGRTIASHRPYRSVEDLLTKRVVRKDVYERIKAQIAAE